MSLSIAQKLGGGTERVRIGVAGVSGSPMDSASVRTHLYIFDQLQTEPWRVEAYGLQRIGIITPSSHCGSTLADVERELTLADPHFAIPRGVDIILGANIYWKVLLPEVRYFKSLLAQKTVFGWTLTGTFPVKTKPPPMTISACSMLNSDESNFSHERLVGLVQRFWAMEEIPKANRKSTSDLECERIYATGHRRYPSGRYIVPLPIKGNDLSLLGESYL